MGRASERVQTGALLGAAVLAVGMVLPLSDASASAPADGVGLLTLGSACGPAETLVGTGGLFARVRADADAPAAASRRRGMGAAKARGAQQPRAATRQAARRPSAPLSRSGPKAPRFGEQEPRAAVLRSFYTCNATPNFAEGTGWRLVGPLRQS